MDDAYQNEDYYNEECQNDSVSEKLSRTQEVHSGPERESTDLVTSDQGYENAVELEYEAIPFSGLRMRQLMQDGAKTEPVLELGKNNQGIQKRSPAWMEKESEVDQWRLKDGQMQILKPQEYKSPFIFLDEKERRAFGKRHFIIFCVVLFCSLIMVTAALVMASLKCFSECPPGWLDVKKSCYLSFTDSKKWHEGRHICKELEADLIAIEDKKEQDFLNYKIHSKQQEFWIGLRYINGEMTKWLNGKSVLYQILDTSALTTDSNATFCITSSKGRSDTYKWNPIDCTKMHPYICEKDKHVTCVLQSPLSQY